MIWRLYPLPSLAGEYAILRKRFRLCTAEEWCSGGTQAWPSQTLGSGRLLAEPRLRGSQILTGMCFRCPNIPKRAVGHNTTVRAVSMRTVLDDRTGNTRSKIVAIYSLLLVFNLGAWLWALLAFRHFPVLLGTAFLAYSFGLRHAVDADHIAAIDNVTRKLMQEGKQPVGVGFMFSLGHSTIVLLGSVAIAWTALTLQHRMDAVREIGGVVGTLVSTFFLFGIAAVNIVVLQSIYRTFTKVRAGEPYVEEDLDLLLGNRGLLGRLFRPIFNMIRSSRHMYPLGVL